MNIVVVNKNLGHLLGFCGVVLFGGTLPAARLAVVVIDSLLLIAARASTAGIAGITLLLVLRRRIPPSRSGHPDSAMRADEVIHEGHDFAATQNVCLWHLANIQVSSGDVRFWG